MVDKVILHINDESVQRICKQDSIMEKLITVIGDVEVTLRSDYLASIVRSIIGQQISVSAASAIYKRLQDQLNGGITAEALLTETNDALRNAGLTKRKTEYVKDLAEKVVSGALDLEHISKYDNQAIIDQLINVKGIGKWTAEMFLILSLGRKDILAIDDVGIQRAAMWLYKTEKAERRNILIEKSPLWKPYRSVASFYLWEAIHKDYILKYRTIDELMQDSLN